MADPLERRVNLLALLLETNEPLTLEQIANELAGQYPDGEVARRGAFERDKAELRELGVPIEQQVLAGDRSGATGYWVDRATYELPDLGLTPQERHALQLAVAAVRLGGEAGGLALLKLGGEADDGEAAPLVAALPSAPALASLFDANARRATVRFTYRGRVRDLDPYGLLTRDGFWYVVGLEHESGMRKTFRVDRIEGGVSVGHAAAFETPAEFDASAAVPEDPKQLGEGAPATALVAVDGLRAASVVREIGDGAVVSRGADGGVVVQVPCTNLPAFRSWLLGLLDHAVVLEPEEVRADVVVWLEVIAGAGADRAGPR
jgi:predicted DNA-binding transcriptional regulator YafY